MVTKLLIFILSSDFKDYFYIEIGLAALLQQYEKVNNDMEKAVKEGEGIGRFVVNWVEPIVCMFWKIIRVEHSSLLLFTLLIEQIFPHKLLILWCFTAGKTSD